MLLKKIIRFPSLLVLFLCFGTPIPAQPIAVDGHKDDFLAQFLAAYPAQFGDILANRKTNMVQVIYTKIDRGANGIAGLKQYSFNIDSTHNVNPAMAARLPIAMLTLQKLATLKETGVSKNTTMLTQKAYSGQTAVYNDPTTRDGKPTIDQYLKRMLIGGEPVAFNRLYELLGQQYIQEQLNNRGYQDIRIMERLGECLTEDENRHTNPILFLKPGNEILYQQPMQYHTTVLPNKKDSIGKIEITTTNSASLEDLHTLLISLVFPNKVTASKRFSITDEDRKYILKYMSQLPTETFSPAYAEESYIYTAASSKYFLPDSLQNGIRVFNAAGVADGQVMDVAYIVDFERKFEFFLSAFIHCGNDNKGSDDKNDTIGKRFMKQLSEVILDYELNRERKITPDLSDVKMEYDGR